MMSAAFCSGPNQGNAIAVAIGFVAVFSYVMGLWQGSLERKK